MKSFRANAVGHHASQNRILGTCRQIHQAHFRRKNEYLFYYSSLNSKAPVFRGCVEYLMAVENSRCPHGSKSRNKKVPVVQLFCRKARCDGSSTQLERDHARTNGLAYSTRHGDE